MKLSQTMSFGSLILSTGQKNREWSKKFSRIDHFGPLKKRWGIETLFGMFKTRRFDLDSTHVTKKERLSTLLT